MAEKASVNDGTTQLADDHANAETTRPMRWVITSILVVVVLILTVLLYGLISGVLAPSAPRTAQEFVLTRAKASVESSPTNGLYWADYIDVLVARKDFSEARAIAARARKSIGSDWSILLVNNAELNMLIAQKEFQKALDSAEKYLEQDKGFQEKLMAEYAKKGITLPFDVNKERVAVGVDTLGYKALAAIGLKKYDTAIDALTLALERDPTAADIATFRGHAYLMKGDKESLEKARTDFTYALKFIPDSSSALEGLAEVEKLTGVKTPGTTVGTATP